MQSLLWGGGVDFELTITGVLLKIGIWVAKLFFCCFHDTRSTFSKVIFLFFPLFEGQIRFSKSNMGAFSEKNYFGKIWQTVNIKIL